MTIRLAHIFRYPIKAHGREEIASVVLSEGACMPWDRHWAVAQARSKFDPSSPAWTPCANFQRAARTQSIMAISGSLDDATGELHLTHPALPDITFHPDQPADAASFIAWLAPISPRDDFRPAALVSVPGRGMTDSAFPSISIKSLASNDAVSRHMARDLSIHRWRGNLWLDGTEPFAELDWIGRDIRIGDAVLHIEEPVGRCKATTANPDTGVSDADTLGALRELLGAQNFGVSGRVIEGGLIRTGDTALLL